MTVRRSLLAILAQGPCYGYQLRDEFARRTGGARTLNVGQVYNTLERLDRDGLAVRGETDEQGHVYWEITDAGREETERWLITPTADTGAEPSELAIRIAIAATTPGVDVTTVVRDQLVASREAAARLHARVQAQDADGPTSLAASIIDSAGATALEAEVAWLERALEHVARHPDAITGVPLADERPRRGRPPR